MNKYLIILGLEALLGQVKDSKDFFNDVMDSMYHFSDPCDITWPRLLEVTGLKPHFQLRRLVVTSKAILVLHCWGFVFVSSPTPVRGSGALRTLLD